MKIRFVVILASAAFLLLCRADMLAEGTPVLVKAVLSTHTYNDKDNDTGIFVDVKSADKTVLLASCANADNSKDKKTEYKKNSDHTVNLEIAGNRITKNACKAFKVHMSQRTSGWETWRFRPTVTLTFSDGSTLRAEGGNVELKNDKGAAEFSAADK